MQKILGFTCIGLFLKKGWETLKFVKILSISWLGFVPFDLFVFMLENYGILTCI